MKNKTSSIWTFYAISILGFWLLTAPKTFGFQSTPLIYSNWCCGVLLVFLGNFARRSPRPIWIWSITAIGIWLQFTPLIFWAPEVIYYLNDTFVGSLVICFALLLHPLPWELSDSEFYVPPNWSFNPSAWPSRIFIGFLAFCCWMISRYLAAYQLGYIETVWEPFFTPGTKAVLESSVSKAFPVPDAGLGAMAYTLEFFSAFLGGKNRWRTAPWAVLIFGILVIPVSFVSVLLIILQPLAVGTWCTLCLTTAVFMLIGIPLAVSEVVATLQFLRQSKKTSFLRLLFKGGMCPGARKSLNGVSLDASLFSLWKTALSGVTIPWNLAFSIGAGISLMIAPGLFPLPNIFKNCDPIAGALAVVVSVIAMSEAIRQVRFINCFFGVWILVLLIELDKFSFTYLYHAIAAILLIGLSFRKGPIREKMG